MARAVIRIAKSAEDDLAEILRWYGQQQMPEVGRRLVVDVIRKIEALAQHPDRGRVVPEFGQVFLRELISPPFRIVYRRDPGKVRVVRIWRSERQLKLP